MPVDDTYAPDDRIEMVCSHSTYHGRVVEVDAGRETVLVEWDEVPGSVTEYHTDRRPGDFILRRVGA